jgi:hypothetical protein
MRAVLLVVVAAACGAPAAPSLSNATQAPTVPADPRASREGMARATFAALAAGDAGRLVELADFAGRSFACPKPDAGDKAIGYERYFELVLGPQLSGAASSIKGLVIEVLEVPPLDDVELRTSTFVGGKYRTCSDAKSLRRELFRTKLRVTGADGPYVTTAELYLWVIDGRYYLDGVPFHIAPGDARTAERATAAAAQMCACRDRACIAAANQAWEQAVEKLPHGFVDLAFGRLITCRSNLETRLGNP